MQEFGMFTERGNTAVAGIVAYHKQYKSTWPVVLQNLRDLADYDSELYGEAMDTVVREYVYDALGFESPFYI
jgi:hypothetical protein